MSGKGYECANSSESEEEFGLSPHSLKEVWWKWKIWWKALNLSKTKNDSSERNTSWKHHGSIG